MGTAAFKYVPQTAATTLAFSSGLSFFYGYLSMLLPVPQAGQGAEGQQVYPGHRLHQPGLRQPR